MSQYRLVCTGSIFVEEITMARKKTIEEPVEVIVEAPVVEEEKEMIWVEAVDFEHGKHMIQVPKEG